MDNMRNDLPTSALINEIVAIEWNMFDKVKNEGGRASCQNNAETFYIMRYSQFSSFDEETLKSYRDDLNSAIREGRNMLTEKYAYMMEYTDPEYYNKNLRAMLPPCDEEKESLVKKIGEIVLSFEEEFAAKYPKIASTGREHKGNEQRFVSFHVYLLGELKTYSMKTLKAYATSLINAKMAGENPSCEIHKMTVMMYGYESLDDAERKL